jgi:putative nucleotidyltransferase with HDIG domain
MINPKLERELKDSPKVTAGKKIWQNKFHEFDIYNHTINCVKHIKKMTSDEDVIVAGYLHDIGKPATKNPKGTNGKDSKRIYHEFHNHEKVGEKMVCEMSDKLFTKYNLNKEKIARLVGAHYIPMKGIKEMRKAINWNDFCAAHQNLLKTLEETGLNKDEVMIIFLADCLSKGKCCTDIEELNLIRRAILNNKGLKKIYNIQKKIYGGKE